MPVVAAVLLNGAVHTVHIEFKLARGFVTTAIGGRAKASREPGSIVGSVGLGSFTAAANAGCCAPVAGSW